MNIKEIRNIFQSGDDFFIANNPLKRFFLQGNFLSLPTKTLLSHRWFNFWNQQLCFVVWLQVICNQHEQSNRVWVYFDIKYQINSCLSIYFHSNKEFQRISKHTIHFFFMKVMKKLDAFESLFKTVIQTHTFMVVYLKKALSNQTISNKLVYFYTQILPLAESVNFYVFPWFWMITKHLVAIN